MVRLIAKSDLRYASRQLKAGEAFEATESDARVLRAANKADDATPVEEQPARKQRSYRRRDMFPEGND